LASPAWSADAKLHQRLLDLKATPDTDQRVTVDSTEAPWRAIGRLNSRLGSHCTATVIGPKRLLTAAHCLWNKRTRSYLPPQTLHFVAGYNKGDYLFHSRVAAIHPAPGYQPLAAKSLAQFSHDWALIDLVNDPVPVTGRIALAKGALNGFQKPSAKAGPYIQAGYSADRRHVLTAHVGCPMFGIERKRKLAIHGCNALPGDSGSPILLALADGSYSLVAIHVGHAAAGTGPGKGIAVPATAIRK